MNRALRASVAFGALAIAASGANAQSTQPPPDVQEQPASEAPPTTENDILVTGSRIRRNPLDLDAPRVFVDQEDIDALLTSRGE